MLEATFPTSISLNSTYDRVIGIYTVVTERPWADVSCSPDEVDDDVSVSVLEGVDVVEEEEGLVAEVLDPAHLAALLVDHVEQVLLLGVPLEALQQGEALHLEI